MTDRRYLPPLRYGPRKREYAYAAAAMSLALFAAYGGDRPQDRVLLTAEPYLLSASGLDCLRQRDGLQLRLAVQHCPDGIATARWCQHSCWYGSIERRDWQ